MKTNQGKLLIFEVASEIELFREDRKYLPKVFPLTNN